MNNEIQNRHRRRWLDNCGGTESEDFQNQATENFNELVDNMLAPTVHRVKCTKPLNYYIEEQYEENIILSDMTRFEAVKDEKLLHVKLTSVIDSGSYIWWNDEKWIVLNEENNAVKSHKTFIIRKCAIDLNLMLDGTQYVYPTYINNLTLYSDGSKELVNLTASSAKYSIMLAENDVTNTINIDTKFIIRGRAFEVSLIDDFTIKNVRTFTICETVTNTRDDIENDIAYNENSEIEDVINPNLEIMGNKIIYLGDTQEYKLPIANSWELEYMKGFKGVELISAQRGKCIIKCSSDSKYIGKTFNLLALDRSGNTIDEIEIRIGGMF